MKTFREFLEEGNKLWRNVEKPLSQGKEIGTVSYERGGMNRSAKSKARKSMEADLQRLRKTGAISGFKKAKGRYQYAEPKPGEQGEGGVSAEKSYVVKQGEGRKAKYFPKILQALGNRYGQESTMRVKKDKRASYIYSKGDVEPVGKVRYNIPLGKEVDGEKVRGDTRLGGQSFTAVNDTNKKGK
jgi:hypothetical protein